MELSERVVEGVTILDLSGRFDVYAAPPIREWLEIATSQAPAQVVVNLRKVAFVDSTGLATLVQGMKRSREHGGDLRLAGLQQPVRMIFELTRLDQAFEIFATELDAVSAFVETGREITA